MKISVHQQGGFLDCDRRVQVDDGRVSVREDGSERWARPLQAGQLAHLEDLASRVARVDSPARRSGSLVFDALDTDIEIQDGSYQKRLQITSGDAVPDEVLELVRLVTSLGEGS